MDKSREQFEAHVLRLAEEKNYAYMDAVLLRAGDEYATMWVDTMWQGWRASRAAIEIELPYYCEGYVHDPELINAIKSQGLKVKE